MQTSRTDVEDHHTVAMMDQEETRSSRRSEWLSDCMQRALGDGFPDGGMIVEGAVFFRNEERPSVIQLQPVAEPIEIKRTASRRLSNWLSYFYPAASSSPSPAKKSSVSPAASTTSSDVETDPIVLHRFSPQPKAAPRKGILKRRPVEVDLLMQSMSMAIDHGSAIGATSVNNEQKQGSRRIVILEKHCILETFGKQEYNRSAIDYIARSLTPTIAMLIKKELNEVKAEMEVHEESRHHTQFYQVR